jgi:hypothetical protein
MGNWFLRSVSSAGIRLSTGRDSIQAQVFYVSLWSLVAKEQYTLRPTMKTHEFSSNEPFVLHRSEMLGILTSHMGRSFHLNLLLQGRCLERLVFVSTKEKEGKTSFGAPLNIAFVGLESHFSSRGRIFDFM